MWEVKTGTEIERIMEIHSSHQLDGVRSCCTAQDHGDGDKWAAGELKGDGQRGRLSLTRNSHSHAHPFLCRSWGGTTLRKTETQRCGIGSYNFREELWSKGYPAAVPGYLLIGLAQNRLANTWNVINPQDSCSPAGRDSESWRSLEKVCQIYTCPSRLNPLVCKQL